MFDINSFSRVIISYSVTLFDLFQFSTKVLEVAKKQRMNTDVRRNIFCVIMTSEDYLDAFEKLLRFVHLSLCQASLTDLKRRSFRFSVCHLELTFHTRFICLKDRPEGQAGEGDCPCSD